MSTYTGISLKDSALADNFTQGELRSYKTQFDSINGGREFLSTDDVTANFSKLGFEKELEDSEADSIVKDYRQGDSGKFDFEAFLRLQLDLDSSQSRLSSKASPRKSPSRRSLLRSSKSSPGWHTTDQSEFRIYVQHVNRFLAVDPHIGPQLPLDPDGDEKGLKELVKTGVLLCKLINLAAPGTIDERTLNLKLNPNPWEAIENHTLALNSARAIGCSVVNIGTEDLAEGKMHLALGLIAQIVKIQLLGRVNVKKMPELVQLMDESEGMEEGFRKLLSLSPESLLLRWVNYQLGKGGKCQKRVTNFSSDLKDCEALVHLLHSLDPQSCDLSTALAMDGPDRATWTVQAAARMGCRWGAGVRPSDLTNHGLAFVAELFRAKPCLAVDPQKAPYAARLRGGAEGSESAEVQAFRTWMNGLGVQGRGGSFLEDVRDGSLLLLLLSNLNPSSSSSLPLPSTAAPRRANHASPLRAKFVSLERCVRAVELGKGLRGVSMVGIAGEDIADGNEKLILGFVWQLMRYHMFSLLESLGAVHSGVSEEAILGWANDRLTGGGKKSQATSFKDKTLSSGMFFLDLLSCVEPRAVDNGLVTRGESEDEKLQNASYIISAARKVGCTIFQSTEDITEVRPKMMLMLAASMMYLDITKKSDQTLMKPHAPKIDQSTLPRERVVENRSPLPINSSSSPQTTNLVASKANGTMDKSSIVDAQENLKAGSFVTPVKGLYHFGVKLKPTPPKS